MAPPKSTSFGILNADCQSQEMDNMSRQGSKESQVRNHQVLTCSVQRIREKKVLRLSACIDHKTSAADLQSANNQSEYSAAPYHSELMPAFATEEAASEHVQQLQNAYDYAWDSLLPPLREYMLLGLFESFREHATAAGSAAEALAVKASAGKEFLNEQQDRPMAILDNLMEQMISSSKETVAGNEVTEVSEETAVPGSALLPAAPQARSQEDILRGLLLADDQSTPSFSQVPSPESILQSLLSNMK